MNTGRLDRKSISRNSHIFTDLRETIAEIILVHVQHGDGFKRLCQLAGEIEKILTRRGAWSLYKPRKASLTLSC